MKCFSCPTGQSAPGTKTATLEREDTLVVVRHVPADVCETCDAAYYSADVTDRLRELLEEAARSQTQVLVREFSFTEIAREKEPARGHAGTPGR